MISNLVVNNIPENPSELLEDVNNKSKVSELL